MGTTHDVQCEEQYCLRWHDFQTNVTSAFSEIRDDEDLLDVTLVCPDGGMLRAHKLMLSACSPMFKAMLQRTPAHPQPVIFMHGVQRHSDVAAILNFMYRGEVNVGEGDIAAFLAIAEDLKVRGLTREDLKDRLPPGIKASCCSKRRGCRTEDGEDSDEDDEPGASAAKKIKPEPASTAPAAAAAAVVMDMAVEQQSSAKKQHVVICEAKGGGSGGTSTEDSVQRKHLFSSRASNVKTESGGKVRRMSMAEDSYRGGGSLDGSGVLGGSNSGEVSYHRLGGRDADDPMSTMMVALSHKGWHCPECLHTSTTKGNLKSHILSGRHKLFEKSHPCTFCHRSYSTRQSLQVHVSTHHRFERDAEYHHNNHHTTNNASNQAKSSSSNHSSQGSRADNKDVTSSSAASVNTPLQTLATTTIAPGQVAQIVQAASYQHQQPKGGGGVPSEVGTTAQQNPFVSYLNQQAAASAMAASVTPAINYQAALGGGGGPAAAGSNTDMRLQ